MSDKTSFTMKLKSGVDDESTRSVTDINSNATDSQIVALAQGFAGLTTDTLESINRVETRELSTAAKLPREMTITPSTVTLTEIKSATTENSAYNAMFNITSDGTDITEDPLSVKGGAYIKGYTCCLPACIRYDIWDGMTISYPNLLVCYGNSYDNLGPTTGTITVAMPENEKYAYAETTITITE